MINEWKSLDKLDCVKEYGFRHKIAHLLGTHRISRCSLAYAKYFAEGLAKGIKNNGS